MNTADAFADSYAEARSRFLAAAEQAGLDVEPHLHPLRGRDGEALALDVALDGPRDARRLLMLSSGCHGVEGFCGSGVQVNLLRDGAWRAAARRAGVAVLYLHGLNPYGFSWWRRTTQENVDLNRNFHDFTRPLPANLAYDEIAALLVPPSWPPSAEVEAALQRFVDERGIAAVQAAASGGQHGHPQGLFYGGINPSWSQQAFRQVLRDHARACERLAWIDLHTGLGPSGVGERIAACSADAAQLQRVRAFWGERVTSIHDGSSTSAPLTGMMWTAIAEECPQAEYSGIALEFGTAPLAETMMALRAEQWLDNHPEAPPDQARRIKQQLRDAFFVDTPAWKEAVLAQSLDAVRDAVAGLAR